MPDHAALPRRVSRSIFLPRVSPIKGVDQPAVVYAELEHAARDEILRSGGSLSHHHGIGKIRRAFLPRVFSKASIEWAAEMKRAIDPTNTFGIANQ